MDIFEYHLFGSQILKTSVMAMMMVIVGNPSLVKLVHVLLEVRFVPLRIVLHHNARTQYRERVRVAPPVRTQVILYPL